MGGISVMKSLMQGFHAAYRVPRSRSFWSETGIAIGMVFLAALPIGGRFGAACVGESGGPTRARLAESRSRSSTPWRAFGYFFPW